MKKMTAFLLTVIICFNFAGCSGKKDNKPFSTKAETSEATTEEMPLSQESSSEATETPQPEPMGKIVPRRRSFYGENTGSEKTYTGLEPLPEAEFPVVDPDNLRGLSEKTHNHSFGVSENEQPHRISVENQKLYEKYGGICLDESGKRVIYLTFDCGYENGCTDEILDTLKEKNVKAMFFLTLPNVKENPELIARMINEGHIVGNHSTTHPDFSTVSRIKMAEEISALDNYLREHFGYSSTYFRFPEGACSESALELVASIGYTSVFWSSAYADWDVNNLKGREYALETVTSRLHPGCVLLLHSVSRDNADALGEIIDYAINKGYEFGVL